MNKIDEIYVVGDKVLISPDNNKDRTESGLYLPQGVKEKEKIQSGYVVKTGPGYAIPYSSDDETWDSSSKQPRYLPLQVEEGDYAMFLRKDSIEIEYKREKYLIIPHAAILLLIRNNSFNLE